MEMKNKIRFVKLSLIGFLICLLVLISLPAFQGIPYDRIMTTLAIVSGLMSIKFSVLVWEKIRKMEKQNDGE